VGDVRGRERTRERRTISHLSRLAVMFHRSEVEPKNVRPSSTMYLLDAAGRSASGRCL